MTDFNTQYDIHLRGKEWFVSVSLYVLMVTRSGAGDVGLQ